jgi:hypothetical protein
MCQANTVDMTPRSPSYEACLAKYSKRGFDVFVPSLICDKIDPTVRFPKHTSLFVLNSSFRRYMNVQSRELKAPHISLY